MPTNALVLADEPQNGEILLSSCPRSPDQHPALVYLASRSRRTMGGDLNSIAQLLTSGRCDLLALDWAALRYSHCAAVRAALAQKYAHSTAKTGCCRHFAEFSKPRGGWACFQPKSIIALWT